jgi:hypothetical protein
VAHGHPGTRSILALAVAAILALALACAGDNDDPGLAGETARPTLPVAVTTAGAGDRATLENEPFVAVRTLPASALSAERLEAAGTAVAQDGAMIAMARATTPEVQQWELVSTADDGWRVWQPAVVVEVLADAGAGASIVSVEAVDWPDACLGAARPDEACAQVITPGYRVIVEQSGATIEYHTARVSEFRRAAS